MVTDSDKMGIQGFRWDRSTNPLTMFSIVAEPSPFLIGCGGVALNDMPLLN